ncbi:hypothetical protein DPMN_045663 [Dreissena polymorpha]|uniref:Uncharacterized protein n=1 Tax=Dreissena polymorpha TaxID=45954 RepID=A0A9D4D6E8_DREPO|nr:hypothetical protein DPMN_045663 [Dreissena polymorpha]
MTTEEPGVATMRTGVGCQEVKVPVAMDGVHIPYQRPQIVDLDANGRKAETNMSTCTKLSGSISAMLTRMLHVLALAQKT